MQIGLKSLFLLGGRCWTRTSDPCDVKAARLSQLIENARKLLRLFAIWSALIRGAIGVAGRHPTKEHCA